MTYRHVIAQKVKQWGQPTLQGNSNFLLFRTAPEPSFVHTSPSPHGGCLKLSPDSIQTTFESLGGGSPIMSTNECASTTDLILQNLCVIVGNPSSRCYANAPWRAFCWMCAYLNREPWGTIKEAAQTSLELSEPVDIKTLPGLNDLWIKHDLNTEGDAAHFVNSLWLKSQTRVTQYRYSEIKRKVATWLSISNSH